MADDRITDRKRINGRESKVRYLTAWNGADSRIVRQSRLEAGERADNDSVLVAIGKVAVREDCADGWLAEYDALFLFLAFLNELRKSVKMVYALLDMIASGFAFDLRPIADSGQSGRIRRGD